MRDRGPSHEAAGLDSGDEVRGPRFMCPKEPERDFWWWWGLWEGSGTGEPKGRRKERDMVACGGPWAGGGDQGCQSEPCGGWGRETWEGVDGEEQSRGRSPGEAYKAR